MLAMVDATVRAIAWAVFTHIGFPIPENRFVWQWINIGYPIRFSKPMFPPFRWMMHRRRGLRTWIISILANAPKNGAEIMDEIETMTQGWWRPSPGSVYPLLDQMTQEDLLKKKDDGRYELTPKAKEELEWPFGMPGRKPQTVEDMLNEMVGYASYLEDLSRSDRSKIAPFREKIKGVADRLAALVGGGKS